METTDALGAAYAQLGLLSLAEHTTETVLRTVADLALATLPGADEVSVTLLAAKGPATVVHTGPLSLAVDEIQYSQGQGPCLAAAESGSEVLVEDMLGETRWPQYAPLAAERGVRGSLSLPIPLQQHGAAALNVYARVAGRIGGHTGTPARTFAAYAGVALANMRLYEDARELAEQMDAAMRSRAVIEQAKGVLMAQRGCSAQDAFDLLVRLSQGSNRKLRDVAETVVGRVSPTT